jgi:hypothetical protein
LISAKTEIGAPPIDLGSGLERENSKRKNKKYQRMRKASFKFGAMHLQFKLPVIRFRPVIWSVQTGSPLHRLEPVPVRHFTG